MNKKLQKKCKITAAAVFSVWFAAGLFLHPETAAAGISDGLLLCARVIIPSLFPFLAISAFLSKSGVGDKIGQMLSPLTRKALHVPDAAGCAVIMGMLGGYPVGGKMIAELCREEKINRREARRLFLYCVNPGPAFAISAVGASVLRNRQSGLLLFVSLIISSMFIGIISGIIHHKDPLSDFAAPKREEKIFRTHMLKLLRTHPAPSTAYARG